MNVIESRYKYKRGFIIYGIDFSAHKTRFLKGARKKNLHFYIQVPGIS